MQEKMQKWNSQTYGKLEIEEIPMKLLLFYNTHKELGEPMEITIGTDSQNKQEGTKIVSVISIICQRHGGIFFHNTHTMGTVKNVKEKLELETNQSLEVAKRLIDLFESDEKYSTVFLNCPISIHIDAGNAPQGKTKDLIQSLTGWVHAMGYDCEIKPNAYAASSIADKISK